MSRYIIKLKDENTETEYYLEWSTIVDAPITWGMSLEEFKIYYKEEYGREGMRGLEERLVKVEKTGHSAYGNITVDQIIDLNRAGVQEENLSKEEIIQKYCIDKS